jgi:hypothetical protein
MVAVPATIPETTPVLPTVAIAGTALDQVPPVVAEIRVVVAPAHNEDVPVIEATVGNPFTVITLVAEALPQLLVTVYDIVAEPTDKPVTTPDVLTEATAKLSLLQVPPIVALVSVMVAVAQTVEEPLIAATVIAGLTAIVLVATDVPHAVEIEYEIVATPVATPETTPVTEPTVATALLLLVHTPPLVALVSVVVAPLHKVAAPVIELTVGAGFTVMLCITVVTPHEVVSV